MEIIEANACEDHIHILITIPPKLSVSKFMGILKGKSSLMIFDQFANLKYKYGNRHFWCRGYYVDTVGRNKEAIKKYHYDTPLMVEHEIEVLQEAGVSLVKILRRWGATCTIKAER